MPIVGTTCTGIIVGTIVGITGIMVGVIVIVVGIIHI